jgi:hypothetical protein
MLTTIAQTAALIDDGWDPWRSLNAFLHAWYDDERDQQVQLVTDPVDLSGTMSRWSLLCVVVVEYVCHEAGVPVPQWVEAVSGTLPEPWYPEEEAASQPKWRQKVHQVTPEEFKRRNIWCSERLFHTKYHWAGVLSR